MSGDVGGVRFVGFWDFLLGLGLGCRLAVGCGARAVFVGLGACGGRVSGPSLLRVSDSPSDSGGRFAVVLWGRPRFVPGGVGRWSPARLWGVDVCVLCRPGILGRRCARGRQYGGRRGPSGTLLTGLPRCALRCRFLMQPLGSELRAADLVCGPVAVGSAIWAGAALSWRSDSGSRAGTVSWACRACVVRGFARGLPA